jgi:hypothetical protein
MVICQHGSENVDRLSIFSYSSFRIGSSFQLVGSTVVQVSSVWGTRFIAEGTNGYSTLFLPLLIQNARGDGVIIAPYQMPEYHIIERRAKGIEHTVRLHCTQVCDMSKMHTIVMIHSFCPLVLPVFTKLCFFYKCVCVCVYGCVCVCVCEKWHYTFLQNKIVVSRFGISVSEWI